MRGASLSRVGLSGVSVRAILERLRQEASLLEGDFVRGLSRDDFAKGDLTCSHFLHTRNTYMPPVIGMMEQQKENTNYIYQQQQRNKYLCIECGRRVTELYKEFNSDIIKITHCDYCKKVADKYVEYDPVIILLDVLLFKPPAFRHILFNSHFTFHWKLSIICLLCDAYIRWAQLLAGEDPPTRHFLNHALQWGFYAMFLVSGIELAVFLVGVILSAKLYVRLGNLQQIVNMTILLKALLLSCSGKLLVIPAVLWGQTDVLTCLWLTRLFIFTSSYQAIRVILNCNRIVACVVVLSGFVTELATTGLTQRLQNALMMMS